MKNKNLLIRDFTEYPGLRHKSISDDSGEEYYHKILNREFKDAYQKNFKLIVTNLSRFFSHLGFAILILSITLNYFFSKELTTNIKLGENIAFDQFSIQFKDSKTKNESNYQELFGTFNIKNENET